MSCCPGESPWVASLPCCGMGWHPCRACGPRGQAPRGFPRCPWASQEAEQARTHDERSAAQERIVRALRQGSLLTKYPYHTGGFSLSNPEPRLRMFQVGNAPPLPPPSPRAHAQRNGRD